MSEPLIDIRPDHWAIVASILARHVAGYEVWAFGSRAKWTAKTYSDLDLAVITDKPLSLSASAALADEFSESDLPFKVDVVDWATTSESFRKIIEQQRIVVQKGSSGRVTAGDWKTLPLEDCMAAIIDYRGKTPEKTTFGVPLVTAKVIKGGRIERPDEFIAEADFDAWMRRGMPERGDIVMTTEAPLGEVAQLDGTKVALAQRVITLRGKPDVLDNTFLKFLLQSSEVQEELLSRGTGTTVVGIRQSELRKVSLTLPPLAEQKAIAAVLGALDDKIELNRRMNATLEAMARALFQSWFVDFDPVRAKLDLPARSAQAGVRPPAGLDPATAALFPNSFQDSSFGSIPKGWDVGSILREAALLSGGTPKTDVPNYWNGDIPWASAKDVSQCGEAFLVSTERTITKLGVDESSTKIIPEFTTVVVARGATTGRLTMFGHSMAMNQTCYGLRSKVGAPFSLYCNARYFIERLVQGGHGSIFDTITTSTFEATDVLLAPKEVLLAFDKLVTPLFHQIRANLHQSRTLATLRDTLLPKLLSGELKAIAAV